MTKSIKVYKLMGESHDVSEEPHIYSSHEAAKNAIELWEDFLGMSTEEALETDEVRIEEWDLHD